MKELLYVAPLALGLLSASAVFGQTAPSAAPSCAESMRLGNYQRSVEICTKQLESAANNPGLRDATLETRAIIHMRERKYQPALDDLNTVISQQPADKPVHPRLLDLRAESYLGVQRVDDAMRDLNDILARFPNHASAWGLRGVAKAISGDQAGAIEDLTQAIRFDSGNPFSGGEKYRLDRGKSYVLLNRLAEADADFEAALTKAPNLAEAHEMRGWVARQRGDHTNAVTHLTRAIALQPNRAVLYLRRGQAYNAMSDKPRAAADYAKATALGLKFE